MNFMNEVDDGCMAFFTKGQKERMVASLNLYRGGLINEIRCDSGYPFAGKAFRLFPNPAKDLINIEVKSECCGNGEVKIYDTLGRLRARGSIFLNTIYPLDISFLPKGFYYLQLDIAQNQKSMVWKITVIR